jgi:hypothetical protein
MELAVGQPVTGKAGTVKAETVMAITSGIIQVYS